MLRRLFGILAALSLVLCLAAGVFWIRNADRPKGTEDEFSFLDPQTGDRLTLRCEGGRTVLAGPPVVPANFPTTRTADGKTADMLVAKQSDAEMGWRIPWRMDQKFGPNPPIDRMQLANPIAIFEGEITFQRQELLPPLLRALEDPNRFISAHTELAILSGDADGRLTWAGMSPQETQDYANYAHVQQDWEAEHKLHVSCDGLRIVLTPARGDKIDFDPAHLDFQLYDQRWVVTADPAQFADLRRQWHRRLDVERFASPTWALVAGTALLPVLWLAWQVLRASIRRRLSALNRCSDCGYDLRGSPERCPECGAAAGAVKSRGRKQRDIAGL
jgi:hypothetical protein